MKVSNISGVILAGGAGSRLGGIIKANIVIEKNTIISGILKIITEVFSEIIIVTNTPEEFSEYSRFKIVGDQFINAGPLGGIHAGLKATAGKALFVCAGDMPHLSRNIIDMQLKYYQDHNCEVLLPIVSGKIEPLHAIYNLTVLKKLEDYLMHENNFAVWEFLKRVEVSLLQLEDTEETKRAFTNINSPSDIPFY